MTDTRAIAFCPHCGNQSPQTLVHVQHATDIAWDTADGSEEELEIVYFIATCGTCASVLVYSDMSPPTDERCFHMTALVYPNEGRLHKAVPVQIRAIYDEARRIFRLAPNAFAVQIRRGLEALCEDRGEKSGPLEKRLKRLAERGEIPTSVAELSDVLRILGNAGAHAAVGSVRPWQVHTIDEFFRMVVEYVYIGPFKLAEFRRSLEQSASVSASPSASASPSQQPDESDFDEDTEQADI